MIVGIRHAEVWNPDGLVYARLPGFHLSEEGRSKASDLAAALARAPVAAIDASPLDRAVQTATILAGPHGLPVRPDDRLLEWSFWMHWQGMEWSRIRERDPELLDVYGRDPAAVLAGEGENHGDSLEHAGQRVLSWAADADRDHPGDLVIGVTHEAPLLAALLLGSGSALADFHGRNLPHLACVRLVPGPAEIVDLAAWAMTC